MLSRLGNVTGVPTATGRTSGTNSLPCWSMTAPGRGGPAMAPGGVSDTTASATGLPRSSLTSTSRRPRSVCAGVRQGISSVSVTAPRIVASARLTAPPASRGLRRLGTKAEDVEHDDRAREAAQRQRADVLGLHQRFDLGVHRLAHEDLAVARLLAEPRAEVRHGADRRVVEASLEADAADGGVAHRDAGPEAEGVPAPAPLGQQRRHGVAHRYRHADGAGRGVGA